MFELGKLYQEKKCGIDRTQAFLRLTLGGRFGSQESQAEAERLAPLLTPARKRMCALRRSSGSSTIPARAKRKKRKMKKKNKEER
jgi:hypothetical protein